MDRGVCQDVFLQRFLGLTPIKDENLQMMCPQERISVQLN